MVERKGMVLSAWRAACLLAGITSLRVPRAAAQALPEPGRPYRVTVPFAVYSRPDSASRVLRTIPPGRTVIAVRITRNGWTEVRLPESKRSIGYGSLTRQVPSLGLGCV